MQNHILYSGNPVDDSNHHDKGKFSASNFSLESTLHFLFISCVLVLYYLKREWKLQHTLCEEVTV